MLSKCSMTHFGFLIAILYFDGKSPAAFIRYIFKLLNENLFLLICEIFRCNVSKSYSIGRAVFLVQVFVNKVKWDILQTQRI